MCDELEICFSKQLCAALLALVISIILSGMILIRTGLIDTKEKPLTNQTFNENDKTN